MFATYLALRGSSLQKVKAYQYLAPTLSTPIGQRQVMSNISRLVALIAVQWSSQYYATQLQFDFCTLDMAINGKHISRPGNDMPCKRRTLLNSYLSLNRN